MCIRDREQGAESKGAEKQQGESQKQETRIKNQETVTQTFNAAPIPSQAAAPVDIAALRARLQRLDDVQLDALCLDHFPDVYDQFGRGLRRDEKINLLLNYIRLNPETAGRL